MKLAFSFVAAMIIFCGFIVLCIYTPLTMTAIAILLATLIIFVPFISIIAFFIYTLLFDH